MESEADAGFHHYRDLNFPTLLQLAAKNEKPNICDICEGCMSWYRSRKYKKGHNLQGEVNTV